MGKEDKMQNGKAVAKEERLKALDAALSQIEKQYGKGSVMKLVISPAACRWRRCQPDP